MIHPTCTPLRLQRLSRTLALAAAPLLTTACLSSDVVAPPAAVAGTITADASAGWAFARLDNQTVVPAAPNGSPPATWDVAFNATSVMLNGGAAGPGGVSGACVCQNASATDAQILAMTAESERADFDAVTSVASGAVFVQETLAPAISGWFAGAGTSATADASRTFIVRLADGTSFAKMRVTALQSPSATSAGRITIEYAVQAAGSGVFGAQQTLSVDVAGGARSVDLNTGTLSSNAAEWDLRLEGFTIRVNGGVSGSGQGAATPGSFTMTSANAFPPQAYRTDTYAGIFGAKRWYRYNLAGDNRISPTFDVYLLKRGNSAFKLQILNYYDAAGQPRRITFRYAQL